jgi:hypothetical protein
MVAKDAVPGKLYKLEERMYRPNGNAECIGMNYISEFVLFLMFDKWGKRTVVTVPLTEEVKPV